MSIEITTAFVEQYKSNVFHLAQQKGSRLRDTVKLETVNGKSHFFERIGSVAAEKRTSRHADTPRMDTPHSRRKVTMDDYDWADLIDNEDKVRMLISPQSEYAMAKLGLRVAFLKNITKQKKRLMLQTLTQMKNAT